MHEHRVEEVPSARVGFAVPRGAGLWARLRRAWRGPDATQIVVFRATHLSNLFGIWLEVIQQFIQPWRQNLG